MHEAMESQHQEQSSPSQVIVVGSMFGGLATARPIMAMKRRVVKNFILECWLWCMLLFLDGLEVMVKDFRMMMVEDRSLRLVGGAGFIPHP